MSLTIEESLALFGYITELSDDYLADEQFKLSNDLAAFAHVILDQAQALEQYRRKPDPVDMLGVWEYYLDNVGELEKLPTDGEGYVAHRQYVVDHLTAFCDHWWLYVHAFFGYADSYDWEFLPVFLGRLNTHDVGKITPVQIEAALAAVISSDSLKLHNLKWEQGL